MPWPSPPSVAERWRARARELRDGAPIVRPDATPEAELRRSPAAARIGGLAAAEGLFSFHFERRAHLPLPLAWVDDPDDAEPPAWAHGVLPERKYQSFQHDLRIASFHPHHRAKWSTHELLHGLVGTAWCSDATLFFHATAGRLAELLPVALWYFFDEAYLQRCPDHDGALYRLHCPACERVALATPDDPDAVDKIAAGIRFVDRELTAITASRRLGRIVPHRHATLDLSSDGEAYARAHGARLASAAFHEHVQAHPEGLATTLDALEHRVEAVLHALLSDAPLPRLAAPTSLVAQDVSWRIAHAAALVDHPPAWIQHLDPHDPAACYATYRGHDDPRLPHADDVFSLGYAIAGLPAGAHQLAEGIRSATPVLAEVLDTDLNQVVAAFTDADQGLTRTPLADRWAAWWTRPSPLADLARWEAAASQLPLAPTPAPLGPPRDPRRQLAPGARVLRFDHDVLAVAEAADQGALAYDGAPVWHAEPAAPQPTFLLLARDAAGDALVLDLDDLTARALLALNDSPPDLPEDAQQTLEELGVLVPVAVQAHRPPDAP